MLYLAIIIIFLASLCSPVQTAVNTKMSSYVHSPLLSAFVSFFVSTVIVAVMALATCHTLWPAREIAAQVPWWGWQGGAAGVLGVTLLVIVFPKLGGVQTVLLPMLGMTVTGLLSDTFGWFGYDAVPLEPNALAGLVIVIAGLFLYTDKNDRGSGGWLYRLLGLVAGIAFSVQAAMNGFLTVEFGSAVFSTWISFAVSDIIFLILALLIPSCRQNLPKIFCPGEKRPWWVWTAGLCGLVYVISFAYFTPVAGLAAVSVVGVFGQLVSSTLIDKFGLFHSARRPIGTRQYIAIAVVLAGTVILNA